MILTGAPILVVKLADIGDAVLSLPAIQAIRSAYPANRIDVLTTSVGAHVYRLSPAVDQVITLEKHRFDRVRGLFSPRGALELGRLSVRLRTAGYGAVILLHHLTTSFGALKFRELARVTGAPVRVGLDNGRGSFLTHRAIDYGFGALPEWQYGLRVVEEIGAASTGEPPVLDIPSGSAAAAERLLDTSGVENGYAVLHTEVGEFSPARSWHHDRFAEVAHTIVEQAGRSVLLVGTERDSISGSPLMNVSGVVNLLGMTDFAELCAIVAGADLVVGCDSAVAHLAGALGCPGIALFGPTNVDAWKPYGAGVAVRESEDVPSGPLIALHSGIPCSPCIYTGYRLGRPGGCPARTCMSSLDAGTVSRIALRILEDRSVTNNHDNRTG